eukprot:g45605.t1
MCALEHPRERGNVHAKNFVRYTGDSDIACGVIVTLEEAQDGHVIQGVGGGVEVVRNWKVLSFVVNRVQVLYKAISKPPLGLTNVEEATSGPADAIDHIGRCV